MNYYNEFKSYITKNYPEQTAFGYLYDVKDFMLFLQNRYKKDINISDTLISIMETDIYFYIEHLKRIEKNSVSTINRKLSSIKRLYGFLLDEKIISSNPTINIKSQTLSNKSKKIFTKDECEKLLKSVNGKNKYRDLSIIMFFLFAGMTVQEVCSLKLADIHAEYIHISSGAGKTRNVEKNNALKSILSQYLNEERTAASQNCEFVFSGNDGKAISKRTIHQIIVKHLKSAGLYEPGVTSEALRKTGAYMLQNFSDYNLDDIKKYLGLNATASLKTYIRDESMHKTKDINKNPLATINL